MYRLCRSISFIANTPPTTALEKVVSYHHYIPLEIRREETDFLKPPNQTKSKTGRNKPFSGAQKTTYLSLF